MIYSKEFYQLFPTFKKGKYKDELDYIFKCNKLEWYKDNENIFIKKINLFWSLIREYKIKLNDFDFEKYNFPDFQKSDYHENIDGKFANNDFNFFFKGFKLNFLDDVNFSGCNFFGNADFYYIKFNGEVNFEETIFHKNVTFLSCEFNDYINCNSIVSIGYCSFSYSKFLYDIDKNLDFVFCEFKSGLSFDNVFSLNGKIKIKKSFIYGELTFYQSNIGNIIIEILDIDKSLFINFGDAKIDKIILSLKDIKKYSNIYVLLYRSLLNYIVCDDKELSKINIASDKLSDFIEYYKNYLINSPIYKIQIHEYRLMQELFKKINIYEGIDEFYYKIMNRSIKNDFNNTNNIFIKYIIYYLKFIFYRIYFGWGVRISNIIFSSLIVIIIFSIFYRYICYDSIIIKNLNDNNNYFNGKINNLSIIDLLWLSITSFFGILIPNFNDQNIQFGSLLDYMFSIESFIGTISITVFVAILSHKFIKL